MKPSMNTSEPRPSPQNACVCAIAEGFRTLKEEAAQALERELGAEARKWLRRRRLSGECVMKLKTRTDRRTLLKTQGPTKKQAGPGALGGRGALLISSDARIQKTCMLNDRSRATELHLVKLSAARSSPGMSVPAEPYPEVGVNHVASVESYRAPHSSQFVQFVAIPLRPRERLLVPFACQQSI
jgi:hypothetical protein